MKSPGANIDWEGVTDRLGYLFVLALIVSVPFAIFPLFQRPTVGQIKYIGIAVYGFSMLFFLLKVMCSRIVVVRNDVDALVSLFFVCQVIAACASELPQATLYSLTDYVPFYLLYLIVINLNLDGRQKKKITLAICLTAFPVALFGVLQSYGLRLAYIGEEREGKLAVLSLMGHPNFVASYLLPAIFLQLYHLFSKGVRKCSTYILKAIMGLFAFTSIYCLFLSGGRAGWLGFIIGASLFYFLVLRHHLAPVLRRSIIGIGVSCTVLLIILMSVKNPIVRTDFNFLQRLTASGEISSRLYSWKIGAMMVFDHPLLGVGFDNYNGYYYSYVNKLMGARFDPVERAMYADMNLHLRGKPPNKAHNDFLQVALDSGFVGLTIFICLLVSLFFSLFRHARVERETEFFLKTLAVAIFSMLVDGLFGFPLFIPCSALSFWLLLGIALPGIRRGKTY